MGSADFVSISDSGSEGENDFDSDGGFDPFLWQGRTNSLKPDPAWSAWHDNHAKFEHDDKEDDMDQDTADVPLFHPHQFIGGHGSKGLTLHSDARKMKLFKRKEV